MNHSTKRITEQIKALRGLDRIPNAPSRPAKDPAKQKAYDLYWATTPTKQTVRELIAGPAFDEVRR